MIDLLKIFFSNMLESMFNIDTKNAVDWFDDIDFDDLDVPEPAVTTDSYISILRER